MGAALLKRGFNKKKFFTTAFIVLALAWPVAHFLVFWLYVNASAVWMSFQRVGTNIADRDTFGKFIAAGWMQYKAVFGNLSDDAGARRALINSLLYMPVSNFISLPLSILFSYLLYKRMPGAGVFRVIFFLPSIIPIVVLTFVFRFVFDPGYGPVNAVLKAFGMSGGDIPNWFGSYPTSQAIIYLYCIWAGLGFNIILLSGAISRIPIEVMEYSRLEGVSMPRELFQVVVPLVWPTITTTFLLGCTSVFSVMMQPLLLTPGDAYTGTVSLIIYNGVQEGRDQSLPYLTALGLTLSVLGLPVIMLIRFLLERPFRDVEY
jgi:ABC-type sugar transport system permease subunit